MSALLTSVGRTGFAGSPIEQTGNAAHRAVVYKLSLTPASEMTRADLYISSAAATPQAVLILCPGFNGDGEMIIRQPAWQEFARANQIALCGVSFVSPEREVQALHGYFQAPRGSGDLLLAGIRQSLGRDLPILIYGFSGGARLAFSVAGWKPERVIGWCAYSTCWWEEPQALPRNSAPGIVACGEDDACNYGTSTTCFAKGRAAGLRWTWLSLAHTGHVWSDPLDHFVRAYFAVLLRQARDKSGVQAVADHNSPNSAGVWRDVDTKVELSRNEAFVQPTLASWLPDQSLDALWKELHSP